jgi:hypothetical protein
VSDEPIPPPAPPAGTAVPTGGGTAGLAAGSAPAGGSTNAASHVGPSAPTSPVDGGAVTFMQVHLRGHAFVYFKRWVDELKAISLFAKVRGGGGEGKGGGGRGCFVSTRPSRRHACSHAPVEGPV